MVAFLVIISSLVLLGAAVTLGLRRKSAMSGPPKPVSAPVDLGRDRLPDAGDRSSDGLAAFYAYQMGAGRVDRLG